MKKKGIAFVLMLLCACLSAGCAKEQNALQDGYYTAKAENFSHGWQEFVTITVRGGKIISTEYNAMNESGFIKSWDNAYMRNMKAITGTYPNEYTRSYAAQLLEQQEVGIDAIAGASTSAGSFDKLSVAVLEQARKGDSQIVTVNTD